MSRATGMCPHDIAHSLEMLNMVAQKDDTPSFDPNSLNGFNSGGFDPNAFGKK